MAPVLRLLISVVLLYFYVVFWVAQLLREKVCYAVSVVALEYDLAAFGGSSACAEGFHFLC